MTKRALCVEIEMGQGWMQALTEAVKRLGGRAVEANFDETYTAVVVSATFSNELDTPEKVQDALWADTRLGAGAASIGVRKV